MVRVIVEAEEVEVCPGCDTVNEGDKLALYECGDCGTTFTRDNSADGSSNRCPDCNKFAASTGNSAGECGCDEALEPRFATENADGDTVVLADAEVYLGGAR